MEKPTHPDTEFGPMTSAIVRLARAHRALTGQLVGEVGLRPEQGAFMMHLWSVGPVRQTALASHFGKDSAATTRAVQRLEHAGFVRRRSDPLDGRATLVEPTAAGDALRSRVEEMWDRLEHIVTDGLSADDRAVALPLIQKMGDVLLSRLTTESARTLNEV
ncbi:MAG: hypothetical protein AVDCRST_MAG66-2651 [uncultured Pseudonocardia sp.]|uniref:HTH marR-type domain-containing protein n=1 Tax=uncultured Pseudonocardia sp. TaxID=211455 RepID=A0A6J4PVN6_9PSEU|nr:MAG: hypothetical protein AVDCRST_MAG66-2651 [uncultured Pseudonocardia sp.]